MWVMSVISTIWLILDPKMSYSDLKLKITVLNAEVKPNPYRYKCGYNRADLLSQLLVHACQIQKRLPG